MTVQSMTKMLFHGVLTLGLATLSVNLFADDAQKKTPTREELFSQASIEKLSRAYGHLIQKSLNNPVIKLDAKLVMKGMQEAQDGKPAPMTEKEYEETFSLIQQYSYEDMANKNLKEAEEYLAKNAKAQGVVEVEPGKIQYLVLKEGSGAAVTEDTMPSINYNASYSNGTVLGSSEQQGGPIDVLLDETIPGFKKGILGMKLGEKRRLFIHPESGYGTGGPLPNGLLIFEIEVAKISPKPASDEDDMDDEDDDDLTIDDEDDFDDISDDDDDDNN
jgi:peptidylprolyl isomerase